MKGRLLTWDDFYDYMSNRKKSMKFNAKETGQSIVVQVPGVLKFEKSENSLTNGLTPVRLQACHTEKNLNKSSVPYEVMRDKLLPSFKNRPILGYIHDVNGVPQFYEHNAHEEDGKIVYDEIAIGNIPETNNAELIYDEEKDRYNVMIDGYLYDEYTKATEIVEREGECPCSVEISIESMKFDAKDKTLIIEDGYFSGVTILGYDENGKKVKPGMENSNVKLKDFYMSNNSILNDLSNEEQSKLVETLNNLNDTLSKMNFSSTQRDEHFKEGGNQENTMTKFEELLSKYNKTAEDITFEYKELSDEDLEKAFAEAFEEKEPDEEPKNEPEEDPENKPKENEAKTDFMKTFSLSHEDIRTSLYALLAPFEETLNEWYWIVNVYDDNFIYQSNTGNYYKQGYSKTEDTVAFEGERQEVYVEFLTDEERRSLEDMKSNYSSTCEKLSKYEEAEELADKMTVFNDKAYENYLETKEFKSLMEKENLKKFTKEELSEKADAALGKLVKENKTFSMKFQQKEEKRPSFLAFAKPDTNSSFLDGLLKK